MIHSAAMAATPSSHTPELLIHVQAEELRATDEHDAIHQLAATFARIAGLPDAQALVNSALLREESEPTYLGKGMALPHARVEGLQHAGVCIARSVAGIPWHTERARLIMFIAVPEEAPELYLHLMSRLVRWRLRLEDASFAAPTLPTQAWEQELHAALAH